MLRNPTEQELRDLVQQRVAASGSPRDKAADAVGTSRQTLTEWEKKPDLRLSQWAALARASGEAIAFRFDPDPADTTKQAPRPGWAEGLEVKLDAIARALGVSLEDEARAHADAALAEHSGPAGGGDPGGSGGSGPSQPAGNSAPRGQ